MIYYRTDAWIILPSATFTSFEENDKNFEFVKHISTETSIIFSQLMYKALEVEFIIIRKMLIMINGDNKKDAKHESVRIKRIVLD